MFLKAFYGSLFVLISMPFFSAFSGFRDGIEMFERGEYMVSTHHFRPFSGDIKAKCYIAAMDEEHPVQKDVIKFITSPEGEESLESGFRDAFMGRLYLTDRIWAADSEERGLSLLKRAAEYNNSYAHYLMGLYHMGVIGNATRDLETAKRCFQQSVELSGHQRSRSYIKNIEDALNNTSFKQPDALPLDNDCVDCPGQTSKIDYQEIEKERLRWRGYIQLYNKVSCENEDATRELIERERAGNIYARAILLISLNAQLIDNEKFRPHDARSARDLYMELRACVIPEANRGNVFFQYIYGVGCEFFEDPINEEEAEKWYNEAAERGHSLAKLSLGRLHYFREPRIPYDDALAIKYFRQAAEEGVLAAKYYMGRMYMEGRGMHHQDIESAKNWFRSAADKGYAPATKAYGELLSSTPLSIPALQTQTERKHPGKKDRGYFGFLGLFNPL